MAVSLEQEQPVSSRSNSYCSSSTTHQSDDTQLISAIFDKHADTDGVGSQHHVGGNDDQMEEDWTDVKHSERKGRDRILDDGVLLQLMQKSDFKGLTRLYANLSLLALTGYLIHRLRIIHPWTSTTNIGQVVDYSYSNFSTILFVFLPLYMFFGFQIQCFAFAGQHEFVHRSAFKSKWLNDLCLFYTGVFCFELGKHERLMHKQHHTFTNNIDRDPELTSFYDRKVLENSEFRVVPSSRWNFLIQFADFLSPFCCRLGRIANSARGIPVDYSGFRWSLKQDVLDKDAMKDLQQSALLQILHYAVLFTMFGLYKDGFQYLLFWWITPVLIGYPVVNYFRNLEHANCEVSKEPNCLHNTRSVRSNWFIRMLLWDTNFHAEHHCYSMVPFFNLHKLNALMRDHVIHNECDHFTTQNWMCLKKGGWIDQQRARMDALEMKNQQEHRRETKKSQ